MKFSSYMCHCPYCKEEMSHCFIFYNNLITESSLWSFSTDLTSRIEQYSRFLDPFVYKTLKIESLSTASNKVVTNVIESKGNIAKTDDSVSLTSFHPLSVLKNLTDMHTTVHRTMTFQATTTTNSNSHYSRSPTVDTPPVGKSKLTKPPSAAETTLLDRSPFKLLAVQQIVLALVESEWKITSAIAELIHERTFAFLSTQIVEDVNNAQTNDPTDTGLTRFRREQTSMAATLKSSKIYQEHKFNPITVNACMAERGIAIYYKTFAGGPHTSFSLPFDSIVGATQKAPNFSPQASNVGIPAGDLELLRVVDRCKLTGSSFSAAWMCFL